MRARNDAVSVAQY